ncbi:MAG: nicotinate-nucleotide diphosphorylase (carboxylating) [Bacteroidetes bacterium CG12_big_fil_rev_8_21_14_0_65_60_17]|nr:MAG: nicotinate-nucleotide diphosphorylase (carboxylating) [Bacteroidetes bacterium CG12_big_fil_rev_8_21_14_0_65_60_17]
MTHMDWDALIARAVAEDLGTGDITSEATVSASLPGRAEIQAKAVGVLAGTEVATRIFRFVHPDLHVVCHVQDGAPVAPGMRLATITGPVAALLAGERTALNVLQRMSGIATLTALFVKATDGTGAIILDTRKTAPGMRTLDKYAVRCGGGHNHRQGLWDMYLIKENHIAAAGGIGPALDRAAEHRAAGHERRISPKIEIEVTSLRELDEVLEHGGADRVMLDNFARPLARGVDVALLEEAVGRVGGRIETEASGNVDLKTVRPIAETGVQYISVGALTHSVTALDITLLIRKA